MGQLNWFNSCFLFLKTPSLIILQSLASMALPGLVNLSSQSRNVSKGLLTENEGLYHVDDSESRRNSTILIAMQFLVNGLSSH